MYGFTDNANDVLSLAQEEAERALHSWVGTEHLLLGLLCEGKGVAAKVLTNLGVQIDVVRSTILSLLGADPWWIVRPIAHTSRVNEVIVISFREARQTGHDHVGTEHVLCGLLLEGEGIAAHLLDDLGVSLEKVRAEIARLRGAGLVEDEKPSTHGSTEEPTSTVP